MELPSIFARWCCHSALKRVPIGVKRAAQGFDLKQKSDQSGPASSPLAFVFYLCQQLIVEEVRKDRHTAPGNSNAA